MCCMLSVVIECLTGLVLSCGRCGLIIVNSILVLSGIGLLILATSSVQKLHEMEKFLNITHTSGICLAAGIVVFLFGLLGYISVFTNSRKILLIFIVSTSCVLFTLIVCLPLVQRSIHQLIDKCSHGVLKQVYEEALQDDDEKKILAWHAMEAQFKCCGFDGPKDWGVAIPPSCCGLKIESLENLIAGSTACTEAYKIGCIDVMKKKAQSLSPLVLAIYIIVILLEIWQLVSLVVRFIFK